MCYYQQNKKAPQKLYAEQNLYYYCDKTACFI